MSKLLRFGWILVLATTAQAQQRSTEEGAGWYGIMFTPVGAFPSLIASAPGDPPRLALNASRWEEPVTGVGQNSYGLTFLPRQKQDIRFAVTVGWVQAAEGVPAKNGTLMAAASAAGKLWGAGRDTSGFGVDWMTTFGLGRSSANGGYEYWSAAGQLPVKWSRALSNRSTLSAFASPGYGVAGVGDFADAEFGLRPLISLGGAWTSAGGVGVHVATQSVLLDVDGESPPWVTGLSISLPLGRN